MQLNLFGKVHLEKSNFSRPKPLLILSYLTLEGAQDRRKLADLFWQDSASETDAKKALQKKLGKLSVVLAQFKKSDAKEVFNFEAGLDPIVSQAITDTQLFLTAIEQKNFESAVALYKGAFLEDIGKNLEKLDVQAKIKEWVLDKREYFANKAQLAMLELAEQKHANGMLVEAKQLAERAYNLKEAPEAEPQTLNRLNKVLSATGSELEDKLENQVEASLEELSELSLKVFLALALQDKPNLTIVKNALKLSLGETDEAREELIINGLLSPESQILAQDLARSWLVERPTERMPLLLVLARNTPAEKAYSLYQRIYEKTQGFGGMGDLKRARQAYCKKAQEYIDVREYALAESLMAELRRVEEVLDVEPDALGRFIEAYALERQGQFKEAIDLLKVLDETDYDPNLIALKAVLLWRTGKSEEAERIARNVLNSGLDWMWAQAVANNALGYLSFANEELHDALSYFKKSASLFQTVGEKYRWVGSLNNYAYALSQLVISETKLSKQTIYKLEDVIEAYEETLAVLESIGDDQALRAKIFFNMGVFFADCEQWEQAEGYYLKAQTLFASNLSHDWNARLFTNLGNLHAAQGKTAEAKQAFAQAVSYAKDAGEYLLQGGALANLAFLNQDIDAMEIALNILFECGNTTDYEVLVMDYQQMIVDRLESILLMNDARQAKRLLKRLGSLYSKQAYVAKEQRITEAIDALSQLTDLKASKDLLMAYIKPVSKLENTVDSLS